MREITEDEVRHYQEHGVVYLPNLLDAEWLERMLKAYNEEMSADVEGLNTLDVVHASEMLSSIGLEPLARGARPSGDFFVRTFNWRKFPAVAALAFGKPFPALVAKLMGSTRINFFGEQLFIKQAGSIHRTAFHQDAPYFHLEGGQCCTVWISPDVVNEENGMMGYVRGSHRWKLYAANTFTGQARIPGSSLEQLPDIEGHEAEYDLVYYPTNPGDVIIHHAYTVHGSTGATGKRDRRAFTLRYLGDDIRYLEREGAPPDSQKSATLENGDRVDSDEFPLIWTAEQGYLMA